MSLESSILGLPPSFVQVDTEFTEFYPTAKPENSLFEKERPVFVGADLQTVLEHFLYSEHSDPCKPELCKWNLPVLVSG